MRTQMNRKRKTKDPCPSCFLHLNLCLCSIIPILDLKTKISLVIHQKEIKRTSNTGQLALKSLLNSTMKVRGVKGAPLSLSDLLTDEYETVLLFPSDDAEVLTPEFIKGIEKKYKLLYPTGIGGKQAKFILVIKNLRI